MATEAQLTANRQNAQLSSGPTSPEGKARASHNALKTGLTGQTILLPSDSLDAYTAHVERLHKQFAPATDEERTLVQFIADTEWRLLRIPGLEAGIYALGRCEFADLFPNETDPATRASFIEAKVQLTYRKDLSNIALQETRLRRHRQLDTDKLAAVQASRRAVEARTKGMSVAAKMYEVATSQGKIFVPKVFGFEFSLEDLQKYIDFEEFKRNMMGHSSSLSKQEYKKALERFVPDHGKDIAA